MCSWEWFLAAFSIPSYSASFFAAMTGGILFAADDGVFGTEVWTSDGTSAGTERVSDIAPGAAGLTLPFFWWTVAACARRPAFPGRVSGRQGLSALAAG